MTSVALQQPEGCHIAQINVATALFDLESPHMEGFTGRIDMVNAVAERSKGFVWRLQTDSGNALDIKVSDDPRFIINISVWDTVDNLHHFVWQTVHARLVESRAQWFPKSAAAHMALWWVKIGHKPSAQEGMARLDTLNRLGPTPEAFDWDYALR